MTTSGAAMAGNGWDEYRKLVEEHMEDTKAALLRIEKRQNQMSEEMARTSMMTRLFGVGIAALISTAINFLWPHK